MTYILHPGTEREVQTTQGDQTGKFYTSLDIDAPDDLGGWFSFNIFMPVVGTPGGLLYSSGYHFVISPGSTSNNPSQLEQQIWQQFANGLLQTINPRDHVTNFSCQNPLQGILEQALEQPIALTVEEFEAGAEPLPPGISLGGPCVAQTLIFGPFPNTYQSVYKQILSVFRKTVQPLIDNNLIYFSAIRSEQVNDVVFSSAGEDRNLHEQREMERDIGKLKSLILIVLRDYPALQAHFMEKVNSSPAYQDVQPISDVVVNFEKSPWIDQLLTGNEYAILQAMLTFDDETLTFYESLQRLPDAERYAVEDILYYIMDGERWMQLLEETRTGRFVMPTPRSITRALPGLKNLGLEDHVAAYELALVSGIENLFDEDMKSALIHEILPIYQQYDLPPTMRESLELLDQEHQEALDALKVAREAERRQQSLKVEQWAADMAYGDLSVADSPLYSVPYNSVSFGVGTPELEEDEFAQQAEHLPASIDVDSIEESASHQAFEELTEEAYEKYDAPPSALYREDLDEVQSDLNDDIGDTWFRNEAPDNHPLVIQYRILMESDEEQEVINKKAELIIKAVMADEALRNQFIESRVEDLQRDEETWYDPEEYEFGERRSEIVATEVMSQAWNAGLITFGVDWDHYVLDVIYQINFKIPAAQLIKAVVEANTISYLESKLDAEAAFDRGTKWKVRTYEVGPDEGFFQIPMLEVKQWT